MNKKILTITSAIAMAFSLVEAKAADMTATLFQEYALWAGNASGLKLWIGNFGSNGGSLYTSGQVQGLLANDKEALFNSFRSLTSFSINDGRISGMNADGFTTLLDVGTAIGYTDEQGLQGRTPDTANQFAGQDLYLLSLENGSNVLDWWNNGAGTNMILFKAAARFGTGDNADGPLNNVDIEISTNGGTLLAGTQLGTPSDSLNTGRIAGTAVPEPSSISLLVLGGTALAALRLRRKKA
jgi:hypothetical protein